MKTIYLSGPMTGLPDFNHAAFYAEEKRLRALGYRIINPAEINSDPETPWQECLRYDLIEMLCDCDSLALLDGWETSKGVFLEMFVAYSVGIRIVLAKDVVQGRTGENNGLD
jgi:hypothetical protein